ncbi:YraN family protein [Caloramator sp. E03]|uniref:YraN family protein n=1 Tax=Caloramator sp. E03 TaxID=2576307 RepID=UPI0011105885|nr:YraN family protein [Caloramator sp. E03]
MLNKKLTGKLGEDIAVKYLKQNGYIILQKNYRTKYGEIDIIAKDDKYLVFIEVKARRSQNFGYPREAVDIYKQTRIKNIASLYLASKKITNSKVRFDVVEVVLDNDDNVKSILIIKDAFD